MTRRRLVLGVAALVVLAACVIVGRWEHTRSVDARNRGIERVERDIATPLVSSRLSAYRFARPLDCLLYDDGAITFRYELCFDTSGRIVEAVDRQSEPAKIWSFREEPSAARWSVPAATLFDAFRRLGAIPRGEHFDGTLPTAYEGAKPTMRGTLWVAGSVGTDVGVSVRGYRFAPGRVCLEELARYELCFDRHGVVVSAADRELHIHETTPAAISPVAARVARLRRILEQLGALPRSESGSSTLALPNRTTEIVRARIRHTAP